MYTEERLVDLLRGLRDLPVGEIHERLLESVREFQAGRPPDDDLTLILVKRDGAAGVA
jgi:serine phosphatase RsbU (regulator of sigma subunit)